MTRHQVLTWIQWSFVAVIVGNGCLLVALAYMSDPVGGAGASMLAAIVGLVVMAFMRDNDRLALRDAVIALYNAAHWTPDRPCDAEALWTAVRDAAHIKPGTGTRVKESK